MRREKGRCLFSFSDVLLVRIRVFTARVTGSRVCAFEASADQMKT